MLLYIISAFVLGFYAGHCITVFFPKSIIFIFVAILVGLMFYLIYFGFDDPVF